MNRQNHRSLLVVDPDPEVAYSFSRIFRPPHFEVLQATSLEQALSLLDRATPDLVLLEERANGHGSMSSIAKLRQRGYSRPVVLMSTTATARTTGAALQAGAVDCLMKPFDLNRVREVVSNAVGKNIERARTPTATDPLKRVEARRSTQPSLPTGTVEPGAIAGDAVFDLLFEEISRRQPLEEGLDSFDIVERHLIRRALETCGGNQSRASLFLGITRNTLRKRVRKYGFGGNSAASEEPEEE